MTFIRSVLACVLLAVSSQAAAQGAPWSRVGPPGSGFFRDSALASDGSLFIATDGHDPARLYRLWKFDPAGNVEWVHSYLSETEYQPLLGAIAATADGGLLAVFNGTASSTVLRLGPAGQLVWAKRISWPAEILFLSFQSLAAGPGGVVHLGGVGAGHAPELSGDTRQITVLVTLSALGQVVRAVRYVSPAEAVLPFYRPVKPSVLHAAPDGTLVLAGNNEYDDGATILRFGLDGTAAWGTHHLNTAADHDHLDVQDARSYEDGHVRMVVTARGRVETTLIVFNADGAVEHLLTRADMHGPAALLADQGYFSCGMRTYAVHEGHRLICRRVSGFGGAVTREYDAGIQAAPFGVSASAGGDRFTLTGSWSCPDTGTYGSVVMSLGGTGESCIASAIVPGQSPPGEHHVFEPLPVETFPIEITVSDDVPGTTGSGAPWPLACVTPCVQAPALAFELSGPQKVLLHKYREDDEYPSVHQAKVPLTAAIPSRDRHILIRARVTQDGVPLADRPVYFRVLDPPDSAPYAAADAHDDDNADPQPKGELLAPEPCAGTPPPDVRCAISGADGYARVILRTSEHIAGENYVVEGSLNAAFACDPCPRSGTITTWKRVYLEMDAMFRAGSFVTREHTPGMDRVFVRDVVARFGAPGTAHRVRLIHAPRLRPDEGETGFFYSEEQDVTVVGDQLNPDGSFVPAHLRLSAGATLLHRYDVDLSFQDSRLHPFLADAVGILAAGSFVPELGPVSGDRSLVQTFFDTAFVDLYLVPQQDSGDVPYEPKVSLPGGSGPVPKALADKWFFNSVRAASVQNPSALPNHLHVIGGTTSFSPDELGVTTLRDAGNVSWSWVGNIERLVATHPQFAGLTASGVVVENVAHELAHQWRVNQPPPPSADWGHCAFDAASKDGTYCRMHTAWGSNAHNQERGDGLLEFHYESVAGTANSEYLSIRRAVEPLH